MKQIISILKISSLVMAGVAIITFFGACEDCTIVDITTGDLPDARIGQSYSADINVDSECRPLFESVWLFSGQLPPGISFDSRGRLRGTPTRLGTYRFTIAATACFSEDVFGYYDCEELTRGYFIAVQE